MPRRNRPNTIGIVLICLTTPLIAHSAERGLSYNEKTLLLDGRPLQIISGEMHPQRIPREYWQHRLKMARAMGLNTVAMYVFWNVIEHEPGRFDFSDRNDFAAFVKLAQEEGLHVILRPGPYCCAEWEWGGFPAWLLRTDGIVVRSSDERFLATAEKYMQRLGEELAPLSHARGGPIIAVQVENEYGSFGDDKVYMGRIRDMIRRAFDDVLLFTVDGPSQLPAGTLPDVFCMVNGDPERDVAVLNKFRPGMPPMVGEFYPGWFDHWGAAHQRRDVAEKSKALEWMLARNYSLNIYMFHGGTSFGFMNGANDGGPGKYQPQTTSYDYDAPLDEAGRPTAKFTAFREHITRHLPPGTSLPPIPATNPVIRIPRFEMRETAALEPMVVKPMQSQQPQTMEQLGQSYGFVFYRTTLPAAGSFKLRIDGVKDYALVMLDGRPIGKLDRRLGEKELSLQVDRAGATLDLLVENCGRINFGRALLQERKGIDGSVLLDGRELRDWQMFCLPMDDLSELSFGATETKGPAFYRGHFDLPETGDTFLDTRGWGKGIVWINGRNLGRFWSIGPQQTLYVPGPWLKKGRNEVIVFDLHPSKKRSLEGLDEPILDEVKAAP